MSDEENKLSHRDDSSEIGLSEILSKVRAQTPARLLAGRSGAAYRTTTQLELREAHAAARDAVRAELALLTDLGTDFVHKWNLFEICSRATTKDEYLARPDLGRQLDDHSRATVLERCAKGRDLQFMVGDGLSVTAVAAQVPRLLPILYQGAIARGWSVGQSFIVRYCRVGIISELGDLLNPRVVVLLIGERPGLATAASLSAYMAYEPKAHHTDANRNLISNIHNRGVSTGQAAERILNLAAAMMKTHTSGCNLREELPAAIHKKILRSP
jgi:ethanolamine ammonia-lyase small subunit